MYFLEHTFDSPEANLAGDEALLEYCESNPGLEMLRVWRAETPFVVVGYSNRAFDGVRLEVCRERGIPALRRRSGGGAVVQAAGCLSYALILDSAGDGAGRPGTAGIRRTNEFVMERQRRALASVVDGPVTVAGFTDLAMNGRKVSGNAQYRRGRFILFHGVFLMGLDVALIEDLLEIPSVAPEYRNGRSHADFLSNLTVPAARLADALRQEWDAAEEIRDPAFLPSIQAVTRRLVPEYQERGAFDLDVRC